MLDFSPRSRDTLSRGFLIEEEIAHAKDAKGGKEYRGFIFNWGRDCSRPAVPGRAYARIGRKGREGDRRV